LNLIWKEELASESIREKQPAPQQRESRATVKPRLWRQRAPHISTSWGESRVWSLEESKKAP